MYNKELYEILAGDAALCALLSTHTMAPGSTKPAIFDDEVPEGVNFPYLSCYIEEYPVDAVVSRFNVIIDYFGHRSVATRTKARQAIDRIEFLLKRKSINTERYGQVEHFDPSIIPVPEQDSRAIHYNIRIEAQGVKKKWLEKLS